MTVTETCVIEPDALEALVLEREGESTGLIESWSGAKALWLVDAVSSGARPGTVHGVDASQDDLPRAIPRIHPSLQPPGDRGDRPGAGTTAGACRSARHRRRAVRSRRRADTRVAAAVPEVVAAVRGEVQRSSER